MSSGPCSGISFLLTWTALVSYLGSAVPAECMTTVQGILGALYFGLGVGVGSLASGMIIDRFNAVIAFYGFAVASLGVMFLFMLLQQVRPSKLFFLVLFKVRWILSILVDICLYLYRCPQLLK